MNPHDLVAYVDVDDTLVRSVGHKRIPMPAVVAHVRALHAAGATLFCRSAGGADYARATACELGLEAVFRAFLPKPNVLLDDQPPSAWPRCIVVAPIGIASASVDAHLRSLAASPDPGAP
jgi:phosphoglycolate phosphatase-like HAD superfamily hydrolase